MVQNVVPIISILKNSYLHEFQCECSLKDESAKFQAAFEKFREEKAVHLQAFKGNCEPFLFLFLLFNIT